MIRITEKSIRKNNLELYNKILDFMVNNENFSFTQKYYNYINNLHEIPKCECGLNCGFISLKNGYHEYCSTKCLSNSNEIKQKILKTCQSKYGTNRFNNIQKTKQTNLKKYGVENISQNEIIKEKKKKIFNEKYGVNSYTQTNDYLEKTKQTNLKKYGVEHHLKLKSQIEKRNENNLKKYGVENPMQLSEIKEKTKQNNLKKYGVESTNQLKIIKLKKKETTLKHFGVESPFQSKIIINKSKKTKLDKYGNENYNNRTKAKETTLKHFGVENPTQNKEIIKRALNTVIKKYGEIWLKHIPSYNPNSIVYLDQISEKLGIKIQHALNGGEKKFIKYWVDGYIEQYNIVIEWDEKKHNNKIIAKKDKIKEDYLINSFGCKIIRINEKDFLKDIEINIQLIINKIQNLYLNN
jgi:hypothetical protein